MNFCYISNFNFTPYTERNGNGSKDFLAQNLWKIWIILPSVQLDSFLSSKWQWELFLNRSIYLYNRYHLFIKFIRCLSHHGAMQRDSPHPSHFKRLNLLVGKISVIFAYCMYLCICACVCVHVCWLTTLNLSWFGIKFDLCTFCSH